MNTYPPTPPVELSISEPGHRYLKGKSCPFSTETIQDNRNAVTVERSHCGEWCPLFAIKELPGDSVEQGPKILAVLNCVWPPHRIQLK